MIGEQQHPKTAVLLHRFDKGGPTWETAVWGTPTMPGRIPTAVAVALELDAVLLIVFGKNQDEDRGGLIRNCLFARIEKLSEFAPALPVLGRWQQNAIREKLKSIFLLSDGLIERTADEVRLVYPIFVENGIERVVFVSNFDHISRIVQLVGTLWFDQGRRDIKVFFYPAMSMYSPPGSRMQDVVVFEPPVTVALGPVNPRRLLNLQKQNNPIVLERIAAALTEVGV